MLRCAQHDSEVLLADALSELRHKVAISMRMLGQHGLVREITGHVSARIPGTNQMFVRCRGGNERGLTYTDVHQIRRVDVDGKSATPSDGFMVPLELPIHGEIYRARTDVQAVVHAHPYASVLCGVLGLSLEPIFGAYDPPALAIAARGVPVYPRSVLIRSRELGEELVQALGDKSCVLMRGHGISVAGPSVESVTMMAMRVEHLARMMVDIAQMGRQPVHISEQDLEVFAPVINGAAVNIARGEEWVWSHYVQVLEDGIGLPKDVDAD
jgi:ribulose-5-phosphate 4-epimerase/fuculose-1-phosphate aldolase